MNCLRRTGINWLLSDFIYVLQEKNKICIPKEINQLKKLQSAEYHPQSKPVAVECRVSESHATIQTIISLGSMSFKTGIVKTQDGREIKLNLNLSMSRSFASNTVLHLRLECLVDLW